MASTQKFQSSDMLSLRRNSATINHLMNYPIVSDGVATIKQNEYGQLTISLGESAYQRLGAPLVSLLSRPFQYVSPYVQRADSLGDMTLSKLDERFPAVRKPTGELYADAKELVLQNHVAEVYGTEYQKAGANGLHSMAWSAVNTAFIVGGETLHWLLGFLAQKKAGEGVTEAKKPAEEPAEEPIDGAWN